MIDFTPEPWDMQENETAKAWGAFQVYRDLGTRRTLREAVKMLGKEPKYQAQMQKWSAKYNWVERCKKFDAHVDVADRVLQEDANREEYSRKLDNYRRETEATSKIMIAIGVKTIQLLQKSLDERLKDPSDMKTRELAALMRASVASIDVGNKLYADSLGVESLQEFLDEKKQT